MTAEHLTFGEKRIVCRQTRRVVKHLGLAFSGAVIVLAADAVTHRHDELDLMTFMGLTMMTVGMLQSITAYMKANRMLARVVRTP